VGPRAGLDVMEKRKIIALPGVELINIMFMQTPATSSEERRCDGLLGNMAFEIILSRV
jgi:hypothetical protein